MSVANASATNANAQPKPKEQLTNGDSKLDEEKLKQFFIGSIDQGTTSTRFIIFNGTGQPVAQHQVEFNQIYAHSG